MQDPRVAPYSRAGPRQPARAGGSAGMSEQRVGGWCFGAIVIAHSGRRDRGSGTGGNGGIAGAVRWYHAALAVNDERADALAAEDGGP